MKAVEILLVEDSPADVILAIEALEQSKLPHHLNVVKDGVEALAYLRREGEFVAACRPDLVLLDLNLPRKNGREVLAEVKSDGKLQRIPIVVLSMSRADEDIATAYSLHANCYVSKPVDFNQFVEVMLAIENFWFNVASLPERLQ